MLQKTPFNTMTARWKKNPSIQNSLDSINYALTSSFEQNSYLISHNSTVSQYSLTLWSANIQCDVSRDLALSSGLRFKIGRRQDKTRGAHSCTCVQKSCWMLNKDVYKEGKEEKKKRWNHDRGAPLVAVGGSGDWNVQLAWEECHRICAGGVRASQAGM